MKQAFPFRPGGRLRMGIFWAVMAVAMLVTVPMSIDLPWWVAPALILGAMAAAAFAMAEIGEARRPGDALQIHPEGLRLRMAYGGPVEIAWDEINAIWYWEPMGLDKLVKARKPHWIGIEPKDSGPLMAGMTPLQQAAVWQNRFLLRPTLSLVATETTTKLPQVMQALVDERPDLHKPERLT